MTTRIFEVIQAMSGQGNTISIPRPYLDFFTGDPQAHLLGAILNQLVFWSGKSELTDGWFYKSYEEIAIEIRGVTKDQVRKAMNKLLDRYFKGVITDDTRKVNGTPIKHYRVDGEALINKIFPPSMDVAVLPHGNGNIATSETAVLPHGNGNIATSETAILPHGNGSIATSMETAVLPLPNGNIATSLETAELPHGNGSIATSFLYTDKKETDLKDKNSSSENSGESSDQEKLSPPTRKGKWGTPEDHQCAEWIFNRIRKLYEKAAETDGEVTRPKEPNWDAWANDIRLMRTIDGRTHRQICDMFRRVQEDKFWIKNVLCPEKLREKWDELVLKLSPVNLAGGQGVQQTSYQNTDYRAGDLSGFRVSD